MININVFSMTEQLKGGSQTYPTKFQRLRRRLYSYTYVQLLAFYSFLNLHMYGFEDFESYTLPLHIRAKHVAPCFCNDHHISER